MPLQFKTIFLTGCLSALVCVAAPNAYAQKWNFLKKGLLPGKVQILTAAAQSKIRRALVRAALLNRPSHFRTVTRAVNTYSFISPKRLLPKPLLLRNRDRIPPLPFEENEKVMFRGMRLDADGKQLRHILRHGMEVSKSHYTCYEPYDGRSYPPGTKAIYAALNPQSAVFFATSLQSSTDEKPFLSVVFHLKRVGWGVYVSVPHDIPPAWIYRVSALFRLNGQLTWGELKMDRDGYFTFTPYSAGKQP